MDSEINISNQVREYLQTLGYSKAVIASGVRVKFNEVADFVIYNENNPWIVAEIKSEGGFPATAERDQLRFHPYIRELQLYATSLKAPYYLLTNGKEFLWFTTDKSGRPTLLSEPVIPSKHKDIEKVGPAKGTLVQIFRELRDLIFRRSSITYGNDAAIIIMAKLLDERGDPSLRETLLGSSDYSNSLVIHALGIPVSEFVNLGYFAEAFSILGRISLSTARAEDLLAAVDEVFIGALYSGQEPRVARWLADFLVRLAVMDDGSKVCDVCSGFGDVLAAIFLPNKDINPSIVQGFSISVEGKIWAQIQQIILGHAHPEIQLGGLNSHFTRGQTIPSDFTHVVSAPSFGLKLNEADQVSRSLLASQGVTYVEDLYLEAAVNKLAERGRAVVLVPDGLLFDVGRRVATRRMILEQTRISAIISLGAGMLMPYSSIKTSALVLEKLQPQAGDKVFMSQIKEELNKGAFDSRELPQFASVLQEFSEWSETGELRPSATSWLVPFERLEIENLTATHYLPASRSGLNLGQLRYPKVQLKEIAVHIKRGKDIKLDDQHGTIPVIGPGAVRQMKIDAVKIGRTTETEIPNNAAIVETGDVVVNLISTHRGEAAVVSDDISGSLVSSKIIVIRPDLSLVIPEYLAAVLNSGYVKPQFENVTSGSVIPALTLNGMYELTIPLPDIDIQHKVASRVRTALRLMSQAREALTRVQDNFEVMIERPFSGLE